MSNAYNSSLTLTEPGLISALDHLGIDIAKVLKLVLSAAETSSYDFLDLDKCQKSINDYFKSIRLKIKLYEIMESYPSVKINWDTDHFMVLTHKFSTLDELERALKNKAFL